MAGWLDTFDEKFDLVALEGRRTAGARVVTALGMSVLLSLNLGILVGAIWVIAAVGCEGCTWLVGAPQARGQTLTTRRRLLFVGSGWVQTTVWSTLAVLYWQTHQPALEIVAVAVLALQLLHASTFGFHTRATLLMMGAPPALCLLILPVLFGQYSGIPQITLGVGMSMTVIYAVNAARENFVTMASLESSELRLKEQTTAAVAANQAKSSFLAMMSHELRTPMNGVLGMAHALKTTSLNVNQASHVEMLLKSGDSLLAILNDILDISKIEANKMDIEINRFDLRALGARVYDLWAEVAREKGVTLIYEFDPATPVWVWGDPTRIRQIMINLVSNALKFTSSGEVRLAVRPMATDEAKGPQTEITVRDTGIGIADEQAARLFNPFTQASDSTYRQYGGTGLGLAICKRLATMMGGDISAKSRPGEGSTFRLTLPLPEAEEQAQEVETATLSDLSGRRILVADDNVINQAVARVILEAAGATVVVAADGVEALAALSASAFDAVLMDIHMPNMGGVEALTRIRAGDAGPKDMPVIALTADAMAGDQDRYARLGFDDTQPKPIRPVELIVAVAEVVAQHAPFAGFSVNMEAKALAS
jgi:signal transduction histidine kinase/AmiR/NasT family two-component response regulator